MFTQEQHSNFSVGGPKARYERLIAQQLIQPDAAQSIALEALELRHIAWPQQLRTGKTWWPWSKSRIAPVKSLYLWGGVGRGKSMLMDLFYDALPEPITKRRVHFHRFMQLVHTRLHALRQTDASDPMQLLVQEIAAQQQVLCFDELQATDVADASLITRIFEQLISAGVLIVSTSNRPPKDLYQGEVQKERFEQLTTLLHDYCDVLEMAGTDDHRTQQIQAMQRRYFSPLGPIADKAINDALDHLSPSHHAEYTALEVQGRVLTLQSFGEKIAYASFAELCGEALGTADYLAIAQQFDVLVLENIPLLSPENRNEAKRFVMLVDALYESRTHLICSAAAAPDGLYPSGHGSFEFERTASRLKEMQSARYSHASETGATYAT